MSKILEIPFYRPTIDQREKDLIAQALNQEEPPRVKTLEDSFKSYVNSPYAVSTSSGTAAMHLAMFALDLKRGDKIICSVNSFPSVAEVIRHFDAEPIFVDIDREDFNIDPEKLEEILEKTPRKKLKGAFISHIGGQPADLDQIYDLAQQYDLKVVEDASHALGVTYGGKKIGSTGADITTFSFSPHMKSSIANGGILTTGDEELQMRASLLRNHAIVTKGWDKYGNLDYVYDVIDIGMKYDISELDASFCIGQLEKNDAIIKRRMEIAAIYNKELADLPHITLPVKNKEHSYFLYIVKVDKNRDTFAKKLKEKGINIGLHFIPLHLLSYYKHKYNLRVNDFPNALANYQQIMSIPIYASLKNEEVEYICKNIKEIAASWV